MQSVIHFSNMSHTLQIFGCHFGIKPAGWGFPRHHHHLFEIIYCWDGVITLTVEDYELSVHKGDLLLLRPGVKHYARNNGPKPYSFFNIHFNIDKLDLHELLTASAYRIMKHESVQETQIHSYLKLIETMMQKGLLKPNHLEWIDSELCINVSNIDKLFLQGNILLILHEVVACLANESKLNEERENKSAQQIDIAHEIESRLQKADCSNGVIAEIAKKQNMSRGHCHKIFTRVYGMSPRQYLSQLKLNEAKQLLLGYHLTIEEISNQLGFSSVSHFSRQFRRWTGTSPNQFRPKAK